MIQSFASTIAYDCVLEAWVTRFQHCHQNTLISKWGTAMDATCHAADSHFKYKLYSDLLHSKMEEHSVLPHNTYNMDKRCDELGP
jgi:hypothetical protein